MYNGGMHDSSQLKKGSANLLILAVLSQGRKHGYAIAREIEARSQSALSMGEGALYPALRALEREGAIVSEWETAGSGPARRVYSLTDEGGRRLKQHIAEWASFTGGVSAILKGSPGYALSS